MVAGGSTDILQVVMFTANAQTLLDRGGATIGARIGSQKDPFKRNHPRIGEEQRWIVGWDQ